MITESEPAVPVVTSERAVAIAPAPGKLVPYEDKRPGGIFGFLRFWASPSHAKRGSAAEEGAVFQLSVVGLHAELQEVEREIASLMTNLAELETQEREALIKRDKLALDVAWQSRERETARLAELEKRRANVHEALVQHFEPELEAWQHRCESAVARWRDDDREQLELIEQSLRQVETLIWGLAQREKRRATERDTLDGDLSALFDKARSMSLTRPEVDWSTEPITFTDITARLESIRDLIKKFDEKWSLQPA